MTLWLYVAVGAMGGVGALARFLLDAVVAARGGREFPWGTFVVNISGSLALGVLSNADLSRDVLLIIGTGLVGSYTTFSTWMLEAHRLAEDGKIRLGALNVVVSLALGLAAAAAGRLIGGGA